MLFPQGPSPGRVSSYITYAAQLFNEQEKDQVQINATGNALPKAVQVAEVVRRRVEGSLPVQWQDF